ncbi:MAG: hypothetical protein C0501_08675 [Isosphaera sp.]|nr:hypothetical protein [Isosphaera sp.]
MPPAHPSPPNHPGRVTVVAPDGTETVQSADALPEWARFAAGRDGRPVPVVLIARVRTGRGFTLRSYGPDGRLLAVSTSPDGNPVRPPGAASGWF